MEPVLIWAIIATVGFFVLTPIPWVISGNRRKKDRVLSERHHAENQEERRNIIAELKNIKKAVEINPTYTPEQKEVMISTAQSIIHTLSGSINAKSDVRGTLTNAPNMNIIDFTAGETGDKDPEHPGGVIKPAKSHANKIQLAHIKRRLGWSARGYKINSISE